MPQARRIEPFAHGDGHFKPGVGGEMESWRPEQFRAARTLLANCEACQACLFDASGENAGHLNGNVTVALAEEDIDQTLQLIVYHLEHCESCLEELLAAEMALADES